MRQPMFEKTVLPIPHSAWTAAIRWRCSTISNFPTATTRTAAQSNWPSLPIRTPNLPEHHIDFQGLSKIWKKFLE